MCCRMMGDSVIPLPHIYGARIKGVEVFCPLDPPPPYEAVAGSSVDTHTQVEYLNVFQACFKPEQIRVFRGVNLEAHSVKAGGKSDRHQHHPVPTRSQTRLRFQIVPGASVVYGCDWCSSCCLYRTSQADEEMHRPIACQSGHPMWY